MLDAANLVEAKTTDKALAGVASAASDAAAKREAARLTASKAFSGEPLKGVGSEVWRALWDAARRYSTEIAYSGQAFPPSQADAGRVLCQQPLDAEARDRMARFEEFIQKDTERQAQEAEIVRELARQALVAVVIGTRQLKANLQEVALQNADLARRTRRFMASCRLPGCPGLLRTTMPPSISLPASRGRRWSCTRWTTLGFRRRATPRSTGRACR